MKYLVLALNILLLTTRAFAHEALCIDDGIWSVQTKTANGVLKIDIFKNTAKDCSGKPVRTLQKENVNFLDIKNGYIVVQTDVTATDTGSIYIFKASDGALYRQYAVADQKVDFDGTNLRYYKTGRVKLSDCPKEENQGFGCYFTQKVSVDIPSGEETPDGPPNIHMSQ
jgi:hypothetical protein